MAPRRFIPKRFRPKRFRPKRFCFALLALAVFPAQLSHGQGVSPEQVKASYILQMRKFIKLGSPGRSPETFCYYEKRDAAAGESVGRILQRYSEKGERGMAVKRMDAIRDFTGCDIFFIPAEEDANIDSILVKLESSSTLVVSDAKRFIFRGGMIGFVLDNQDRVKMEANLKNLRKKSIAVDAQVLEIMQQVVSQ